MIAWIKHVIFGCKRDCHLWEETTDSPWRTHGGTYPLRCKACGAKGSYVFQRPEC